MGKPNTQGKSFQVGALPHNTRGETSVTVPFIDDDAPELDLDDLPPNYDDAIESSEAAPMLPADSAMTMTMNDTIRPHDPDAIVVTDHSSGTQTWVAHSLEDPVELEIYIRRLASIPPRPYIQLIGTHTETSRDSKGRDEKNDVTDFDVKVELTPYLFSDARFRKSWSELRTVNNAEKARRGTVLAKRARGPKQSIELGGDAKPTLQEWCHRFGASSAGLKCFTLKRHMVGFDEQGVKNRLEQLVRSTNYRGNLQVQLLMKDHEVHLYNDAKINRWRLNRWIRFFFFATLTFLLSWPYLFFRTKRWEVAVADWSFSRFNRAGNKDYVSISEEQWYNMWAQAICRAVLERRQTLLDQADLRRAHEADPAFNAGNAGMAGGLGLFRANMSAMNEVNRQLGWGGDC